MWMNHQHRPGQPIHHESMGGSAGQPWHQGEHGRQGSLQGQHLDRTLLENHQTGMGLSQPRRHGGRTSKWNRQLHQVLQLQASTPVHR